MDRGDAGVARLAFQPQVEVGRIDADEGGGTLAPDLREQLIGAGVTHVDGVLFTHEHADHTHGIDDLRPLAILHRKRVDIYADDDTSRMLHQRFGYCFATPPGSAYPPILTEHRFREGREIVVDGAGGPITALPFRQRHGDIDSFGFRFGDVA